MKRWRRRGAATVEAVILLPTLVILLLGARFIARRYEAEVRALREARTCAVRFAYGGCREMPAGCAASLVDPSGTTSPDDAMAGISRQLADAEASVKRLSSVPVLGNAIDALFGQKARSERSVVFEGPERSSKTRALVRGSVLFPCNELPRTDDVARQVFESVTAPFF